MSQHTGPENGPPRRTGRRTRFADAGPLPGFRVLPGDTTVPAGPGLAGLLGLIALTGSVVATTIAAVAVLIGWLVTTDRGDGGNPPDPYSGARLWF